MVPAGTYGTFTREQRQRLHMIGVAGGDDLPVVYNLQSLTLNSNSQIHMLGPVIVNVASGA